MRLTATFLLALLVTATVGQSLTVPDAILAGLHDEDDSTPAPYAATAPVPELPPARTDGEPARGQILPATTASGRIADVLGVPHDHGTAAPGSDHRAKDTVPVGHMDGSEHAPGSHIVMAAAGTPDPAYGPGGSRDFEFVCPSGPEVFGVPLPSTGGGDDPVVYGCPIRVYDTGYSFGNPHIVMDHVDHRLGAFFALHGSPTSNGPSERSRQGLTHVAFTTDAQGTEWQDQPTDGAYSGAYGEFASGAMDSNANLYSSYLWHLPLGPGVWDSLIGLFKGPDPGVRGGMDPAYENGYYLLGRDPGNMIEAAHMLQLPSFAPLPPEETLINETAPPSGEDEDGEVARDHENATEERVVVTWFERAENYTTSVTGLSGWIDAAWSHTGAAQDWTRMNKTQLIGPCKEASNPAYFEDKVYVACVVERGYADRPRARIGDIDLWEIDVYTGNTTLVGPTGLSGGKPLLAVSTDGYFSMVTQKPMYDDDGNLRRLIVNPSFGWYGRSMGADAVDIGADLRRMADNSANADSIPLLDAAVTALVVTEDEHTSMMVYKEWHDDPQDITTVPENPADIISDRLTDYNKFFVSYNQCQTPIAAAKMELGAAVDANNAEAYQLNPGIFNDVQDGLFVTREPGGEELAYFAINDYGAVQFGAVTAFSASEFCFIPPPPPIIPPTIVPQALTLTTPFSAAVGAAVAVPSVAMIGYLLTVKRRVAHFAAVEDN